jgi:hypothetical protein
VETEKPGPVDGPRIANMTARIGGSGTLTGKLGRKGFTVIGKPGDDVERHNQDFWTLAEL